MDSEDARARLVVALQMAYSGELGAAYAYAGHKRALARPRHADDRMLIARVLRDELRHRKLVGRMLASLGAGPDPRRERKLARIGRSIACFCRIGGWFWPMYGAARLERDNVIEYEIAAQLAWRAGEPTLIDGLLDLAEVEWDHERWLRERSMTHWMWKVVPGWEPPPPRASIRRRFGDFRADPAAEPLQRTSWLR